MEEINKKIKFALGVLEEVADSTGYEIVTSVKLSSNKYLVKIKIEKEDINKSKMVSVEQSYKSIKDVKDKPTRAILYKEFVAKYYPESFEVFSGGENY